MRNLTAEAAVLDRLVEIFAGTKLEVVREGDRPSLQGSVFDAAGSAAEVRAVSQRLLPRVSAELRPNDLTWVSVRLADRTNPGPETYKPWRSEPTTTTGSTSRP